MGQILLQTVGILSFGFTRRSLTALRPTTVSSETRSKLLYVITVFQAIIEQLVLLMNQLTTAPPWGGPTLQITIKTEILNFQTEVTTIKHYFPSFEFGCYFLIDAIMAQRVLNLYFKEPLEFWFWGFQEVQRVYLGILNLLASCSITSSLHIHYIYLYCVI